MTSPEWPWQRNVAASPLLLESVRAPAGSASPEVEDFHFAVDCLFHQTGIEHHVRRGPVEFPQRRRPGHLELVAPMQATGAGYGYSTLAVHGREQHRRAECR